MGRPKKKEPNRKDGRYEVKVTVGKKMDGAPIRKSFFSSVSTEDARKKAAAWKVEQRAAEITGTVFVEAGSTFADWARKWLQVYKEPNVDENTYRLIYLNSVENHLIPYFGQADLRTIQPINIQEFFSSKKQLSESMLSKFHMCLMGIFDAAIENDLCYKNPARSKSITITSSREKNEKKVLNDAQIKKVCSLCPLPEVTLMLHSGLRRGEVCGLMWSDVNLAARTLSVNRSIANIPGDETKANPPKWGSVRTIPIDDVLLHLLESLPHRSLYVFPNQAGSVQSPGALARRLERRMEQLPLEIPRLTAHELRHTFGTALRRRGVDIYTIQKVMGHKDIKVTTEIYVHNEVESLKKAMKVPSQKKSQQA